MSKAPQLLLERSDTQRRRRDLGADRSTAQRAGALIVVADRLVGRRLASMLTKKGYVGVRAVSSVSRALVLAHEHDPGFVFVDLELSDDAYDLARVLQHHAGHDAHRLIALTPAIEQSTRERARRAGFERWLVTPVVQSELDDLLVEHQTPVTG